MISKIVHFTSVKVIPISVILELDKIKKQFVWKNGNPKIKRGIFCKDHENTCFKNVGITFKMIRFKCSWVKRLYDSGTYDCKLMPLHITTQKLGKHFLFHSNLYIDPKKIR